MYYYIVDEKLPPPLPLFNKVTFDRKIYTYFYMAICEKRQKITPSILIGTIGFEKWATKRCI